jgi:hypothetical protein
MGPYGQDADSKTLFQSNPLRIWGIDATAASIFATAVIAGNRLSRFLIAVSGPWGVLVAMIHFGVMLALDEEICLIHGLGTCFLTAKSSWRQ